MFKIMLIRHATAEPESPSSTDFDRNLDPMGVKEALSLGTFLKQKNEIPEIVFSSPAQRTMQTTRQFLSVLNLDFETTCKPDFNLYNSGYANLLSFLVKSESSSPTLALVAHNPGISQLATVLSEDAAYQLSPGSAVCLSFATDSLKNIKSGTGKQKH
jgi:phosphohistidine phosphatase